MKRYFKCNKCGSTAFTNDGGAPYMCTAPASYRTSGICGGAFHSITKAEFEKTREGKGKV